MSIVSCPRCGDKVSVPPAASPSALVQCPLCCEEYYLSDALIQLPPMLRVVGGTAAAGEKAVDYRLAEPVEAAVHEANFDAGAIGAAATAARPQLRTVARPRRQEKSPVGEIIKVVLGGAAGLAGGMLVLWWGFGVDVGALGPKLSKVEYLRFLVPQKLWDESVRSGKNGAQLESAGGTRQATGSGKSKPGGRNGSVAGGSGKRRPTASGNGEDAADTPAVKGDPFLTLDDLGTEFAPAQSVGEVQLDDPLSALSGSKKSEPGKGDGEATEVTEVTEVKPAAASGDKPSEPPPAKTKSDDPPAETDKPSEESNPEEKPAAGKPADERPGAEKKEAEADAEANPE